MGSQYAISRPPWAVLCYLGRIFGRSGSWGPHSYFGTILKLLWHPKAFLGLFGAILGISEAVMGLINTYKQIAKFPPHPSGPQPLGALDAIKKWRF